MRPGEKFDFIGRIEAVQIGPLFLSNGDVQKLVPGQRYVSKDDYEEPFNPNDPWSYNQFSKPETIPQSLVPSFISLALHDEPHCMFHGVRMIHRILSLRRNPPIGEVMKNHKLIQRLLAHLARDDWPELQLEVLVVLTIMVRRGHQSETRLMDLNAMPLVAQLSDSPHDKIRESAAALLDEFLAMCHAAS